MYNVKVTDQEALGILNGIKQAEIDSIEYDKREIARLKDKIKLKSYNREDYKELEDELKRREDMLEYLNKCVATYNLAIDYISKNMEEGKDE